MALGGQGSAITLAVRDVIYNPGDAHSDRLGDVVSARFIHSILPVFPFANFMCLVGEIPENYMAVLYLILFSP